MSRFVVDASVALKWFFLDESPSDAVASLGARARDGDAVAPGIWLYEMVNGFRSAERRGRSTAADTADDIEDLRALPVEVVAYPNLDDVVRLSRSHDLSVYDAAYLDLAEALRLPLATKDGRLIAAAQAAGVELLRV